MRRETRWNFSCVQNAMRHSAKRFFLKALGSCTDLVPQAGTNEEKVAQLAAKSDRPTPRVINVEKNAASPRAIAELKASGVLPSSVELRQVKYLNHWVEHDHRFLKRLVRASFRFKQHTGPYKDMR